MKKKMDFQQYLVTTIKQYCQLSQNGFKYNMLVKSTLYKRDANVDIVMKLGKVNSGSSLLMQLLKICFCH